MAKHLRWVVFVFVVMLVLAACAAGPNVSVDEPSADGEVAGFWMGLWHGIIVHSLDVPRNAYNPVEGVFLSNGPGDPATQDELVATIRILLAVGVGALATSQD